MTTIARGERHETDRQHRDRIEVTPLDEVGETEREREAIPAILTCDPADTNTMSATGNANHSGRKRKIQSNATNTAKVKGC